MAELLFALAYVSEFLTTTHYADDVRNMESDKNTTITDQSKDIKTVASHSTFGGKLGALTRVLKRHLGILERLVIGRDANELTLPDEHEPTIVFLKTSALIEDKYGPAIRKLGSGNHSVVHQRGKMVKGEVKYFAVKVFKAPRAKEAGPMSLGTYKMILNEVEIASTLCHENIIRTYELLRTSRQQLCVVMELCRGGTLGELIDREDTIDPVIAGTYIRQIMAGIRYLHDEVDVAHRDIKPNNVLLFPGNVVKITDFGLASQRDPDERGMTRPPVIMEGRLGTRAYWGPEKFLNHEVVAKPMDVWAAGVIYLEMTIGLGAVWLHARGGDEKYVKHVESRQRDLASGNPVEHWKATIYKVLDPDPITRITARRFFEEPWANEIQDCEAATSE